MTEKMRKQKIFSQKSYERYPHHLDNPENIKLIKTMRSLTKSEKKLIKARVLRMWVENNPKIHLLNYFYFRIKDRKVIKMMMERYVK